MCHSSALKVFIDFTWHRIGVKCPEKFGFLWYLSAVPGEGMHGALPGKYTEDFFAPFWFTNARRGTPRGDFTTHFCSPAVYGVSSGMPVRPCVFDLTG